MPGTSQPTDLIPDDLLSNIKKGDCVLFLGADLPLGYPAAPPSRPELAVALGKRYGLPANLSWPETVQRPTWAAFPATATASFASCRRSAAARR